MCSSDGEISATDEALQKSQAAMTSTLNADYSTAFKENQQLLAQQKAKLAYIAANPMGYTAPQLHTATTAINENTATAAKQAIGAAAAYAAAHGGADVGSGVTGEVAGQIASAAGQSKAQQLSSLSQQNEELKQQNFWKAISGLNEVGKDYGSSAGTALSGAGNAANTSVGAGGGALQANEAGWQEFGSVLSGISGLAKSGVEAYIHA